MQGTGSPTSYLFIYIYMSMMPNLKPSQQENLLSGKRERGDEREREREVDRKRKRERER